MSRATPIATMFAGRAPMISTFQHGTLFSLADVQGCMYPRTQTPNYQRMVEAGHFRAFLQQASYVIAAFSGFVSVGAYWLGYYMGKIGGLDSANKFYPGWGERRVTMPGAAPVTTRSIDS